MKIAFLTLVVGAFVVSTANAQKDSAVPKEVTRTAAGDVALDPIKPPRLARILGVYDDVGAAEGVQVVDLLSGSSVLTTKTGTAHLGWVASQHDTAAIMLRKVGYVEQRMLVVLSDTTPITVLMEKLPVELDAIKTTATTLSLKMQTFTERARSQTGTFVTPDEFAERYWGRHLSMIELLKQRQFTPKSYTRGNPNCIQVTLIDGKDVDSMGDLADDYQAIEFYHSALTFPAVYGVGAQRRGEEVCTLLVLWTKDYGR